MAIKKCSKCGWEVAHTYAATICPVCGTRYVDGPCRICGEYAPRLVNGTNCVRCHRKKYNIAENSAEWERRRRANNDKRFAEWRSKMQQLPKDYPTLTQQQWLEACRYFDGCAYCGADSIDARAYFVKFEEGGRYCDWNIIPACEKCATKIKLLANPFAYLENAPSRKKLQNIIKYLEEKLDAAVAKSTGASKQDDS